MEFSSLQEVYAHLENTNFSLKRDWELTSGMKRLVDNVEDDEIKNKLKWECFVFDFMIQNGKVLPMSSTTTEDGITVFAYPSYSDFGNDGLNYIKERANIVSSDYLIARYNHVLWNAPAPYKNAHHAQRAVDIYLKILEASDCLKEEKREGRDCLELVKNALLLALQAKYKVKDVLAMIYRLLFEKRKISNHYKVFILDFMLEQPQIKKSDFQGCIQLIERILSSMKRKNNELYFIKRICETGLQIARKTNNDTKIWNKRIGDTIVKMADSRMNDDTRMIPLSFLKEAIPYYKLAGLQKKIKEIEYRYFELKKELKLSKIEVPLEDDAAESLDQYLTLKTDRLLALPPKDIIGYILTGKDIFPQKTWLIKMAKDRNNAFLDLFTTMHFDINNNISKQKGDKTAKDSTKIYENYHYYVQLYVLPLLHIVFIKGIKKDKINFKELINFMIENTWFGQEIIGYDSEGNAVQYNWISLLGPAILEYFKQTESALKSSTPHTNYVMPIDSLTLKFEGALRDFAGLLYISTTVTGKGNILREKYIEELLSDKKMQDYFDEDDLLLFNFLFVAKDGMNLRNNIAHCFYKFNNYNFHIMHLLFCAFLRLGKYKIRINKG